MSDLIFDPRTVNKQDHFLTRMLRLLFTRRRVTEDDFYQLHYRYDMQYNKTPYKIQSDRNNLKRILRMDENLSFKKFIFAIVDILDLDILEIKITLQDKQTRERFSISSRDRVTDQGDYVPAAPLDEKDHK